MGISLEDADCTTQAANPAWTQQRHRHGSAVSLSVTECRRQNQVIWNDKPHQRLLVRRRIVSSKPRFRLPANSCAGTIHERGDRLRETTSLCQHTCRHSEDSSGTSILLLGYRFLDDQLLGYGFLDAQLFRYGFLDDQLLGCWLHGLGSGLDD